MLSSCPKCSHDRIIKDGLIKGKQRYQCKRCVYRFTVQRRNSKEASKSIKKKALQMYLEGLGYRSIGRILNFSHVAVYNWIKQYAQAVGDLVPEESGSGLKVVELDELHTYVGSKKTTDGYGLLLIDLQSDLSLLSVETGLLKQV